MKSTAALPRSPRPRAAILAAVLVLSLGFAVANNVIVGVAEEATNLDPRHATDVSSAQVTHLVYANLLEWDENLNIVPVLATTIENPDDRTYVFHLRDDVYFHDGVKLTSADVKYTYDTLRDPDFGARNIGFYRDIVSIETPDDYTVVITLEQPNAPFLYYLNVGIVPMHYAEEYGSDHISTTPLGAGAFVFEEWRTGEYIRLSANPDYFDGRPSIDEVRIRPIPDPITRTIELETGGVHVIDLIDDLDVERLEMDPNIDVMRQPGTGFDYIFLHTQRPPFDDVRVRQAIAYLVPRQDIVESLLYGVGLVAYTPIIPQSWAHELDVERFDFDVERARALLVEAGHADGFDIVLEVSSAPRRQMAEVLQQEFAKVGINASIREREWGALYADMLEGRVDVFIGGWRAQTDPDRGLYRQFHSDNWIPAGANRQEYKNERVDELLAAARTTPDFEVRRELYSEAQKIIVEEASYVYIFYPETVTAKTPRLQGFEYDGYFYFRDLRSATLN